METTTQQCACRAPTIVVGAVTGWDGQLLVVQPGASACYRCAVRGEPAADALPSCATAGILGPVAGVVGSLQAVEALKLCLGMPVTTAGRFLFYDGREAQLTTVQVRRDPACLACGKGRP